LQGTLGQRELLGAKVLSMIKGIESDKIKSELSLDLFMYMECGIDGRWAIVWFEVDEVGPKPLKPTGHNFIPSSPINTTKPKSVWRTRQSQTLVNPAHCQSLKSELIAQLLGSQVQKLMEIPLPLERQVVASSSGDEMMTMRVCGDPMTGKESESRCSSDIANLDFNKAFSRFTSPGAEVTHGFGFRDSRFTSDMVISSAMAGIEPRF